MRIPSLLLAATLLGAAAASAQDTDPRDPGQPEEEPAPQPPPGQGRGGAAPSDDAFRMGSPPQLQEGLTEEDMWPAATAEGWKKPVLVTWQRSFDDALRVARAENRPVLVCVNMDGEIASEHWAGVRYREPETAAMMNRYACVIASVYRHTPRDHDEDGSRVECPRFGTVTCGEHIDAERELYGKYFDGRRISPRHIVLDLEGGETFDVYYSWDTATVSTTFQKGVEGWPEPDEPGDRSLVQMAKSADVTDRKAVEQAYVEGDKETRRMLLSSLAEEHVVDQTEVLRKALFGYDQELASMAREALARCETEGALDLMAEALKVPLPQKERGLLLDAVERLGETSKRARTLAALHGGLAVRSRVIDLDALAQAAREYGQSARGGVDASARADAADDSPEDPAARLELAEALLALASDPGASVPPELCYQDALDAAREAERLGASGPRLDAALALAADGLGDHAVARVRAVAAIEAGLLAGGDEVAAPALDERQRAILLLLFAQQRQRSIRVAYRRGGEWPPEWLADVNTAYATVAQSEVADPELLVEHHDFLRWIGATPRANAVLEDALRRFPDSPLLHERLRARLLWEGGPENLEAGYAERLAAEEADGAERTQLDWFAAYASLVAAEHRRRRGAFEAAVGSYQRAIEGFRANAERLPSGADTCAHFIALARAGLARLALERGELAEATDELLSAFRLRPDSAATPDGLNLTPIQTAKMLMARLLDVGDEARADQVQAALDALDPRLLEPPPSEAGGSGGRGRRGGPPPRGGR